MIKDYLIRLKAEGADGVKKEFDGIIGSSEKLSSTLAEVGTAAKGFAAVGAAVVATLAAIGAATTQAMEMAVLGDEVNNLSGQFEQISVNSGKNYVAFLSELKDASDGAISNTQLYAIANKAMSAGLEENGLSLSEIISLTNKYAETTGIDAVQAIESVTKSMSTGKVMALQAMGIQLDLTKATEDYAKSIGVAVEDLTDQEKKIISQNAAMEGLRNATIGLTDVTAGAGDAADRVSAEWDNLVSEFMSAFDQSESLRAAFLELQGALLELDFVQLGTDVAEFASYIVNAAAKVVEFARSLQLVLDQEGSLQSMLEKQGKAFAAQVTTLDQLSSAYDQTGRAIAETQLKVAALEGQFESYKTGGLELTHDQLVALMKDIEVGKGTLEGFRVQMSELEKQEVKLQKAKETLAVTEQKVTTVRKVGKKAADEQAKAEEEIKKAVESLDKSYENLIRTIEQRSIEDAMEGAIRSADNANFDELRAKLEASTVEGLTGGMTDPAVVAAAEKLGKAQVDEVVRGMEEDAAADVQAAMEDSLQGATDFWGEILTGVVEGDLETTLKDMLKRQAIEFGAQMLGQMTVAMMGGGGGAGGGGFDWMSMLSGGGDFSSWFGGASGGSGATGSAAAGASGGGASGASSGVAGVSSATILAAVAAIYGYQAYDSGKGLFDGSGSNDRKSGIETAMMSNLMTAWIPVLTNAIGLDNIWGSSGDRQSHEREGIFDSLSETTGREFDIGNRDRFEGEWVEAFENVAGEGQAAFAAVGEGIVRMSGISSDIGGQIGFLLAENVGGSMSELLAIMDEVGLNAGEMKEELKLAFLDGEVALDSFGFQLQGLNQLQDMNIAGSANIAGAIEEMAKNIDGTPREKLLSYQLLWTELGEAGVTSVGAMGEALVDRLGPQARDVFANIEAAGIGSFDNITDLSADQIYLIISEMSKLEGQVTASFGGIEGAGDNFENEADKMVSAMGRVERAARDADSAVRNLTRNQNTSLESASKQELGTTA